MRVLQADSNNAEWAIETARSLRCDAIAWTLAPDSEAAALQAGQAGISSQGWHQAARDPDAALTHPEWMHAPQHNEWLRLFPDYSGGHPALVAPYIGLNTVLAADHALNRLGDLMAQCAWAQSVFLADIQGPPMGCGCGNPCCRSWDNAPGAKVTPSAYERPSEQFAVTFYQRVLRLFPNVRWTPIVCPECERGIAYDGLPDADGPGGTDLCQGVACFSPCADHCGPMLFSGIREAAANVGILLLTTAFGKDHPCFGAPRSWAPLAHAKYGLDLLPAIEPEDADAFEQCIIVTSAPQECWPVVPPEDYVPIVAPLCCG